jgi:hypothetical protein
MLKHWTKSRVILLLIDGIDEVSQESRYTFIEAINRWTTSSHGGKVIATCRSREYVEFGRRIVHDQIATLQPLSNKAISTYLSDAATEQEMAANSHEISTLLRFITESSPVTTEMWRSPLFIQLVIDGLRRLPGQQNDGAADRDAGAVALEIGDKLSQASDINAAREAYQTAIETEGSPWRAAAAVRLSLLLERVGDTTGAREALNKSLSVRLEESMQLALTPPDTPLNEDEQQVLNSFESDELYDEIEVCSRSFIQLSRCREALRGLRDRGLVLIVDDSGHRKRFQKTSTNLAVSE